MKFIMSLVIVSLSSWTFAFDNLIMNPDFKNKLNSWEILKINAKGNVQLLDSNKDKILKITNLTNKGWVRVQQDIKVKPQTTYNFEFKLKGLDNNAGIMVRLLPYSDKKLPPLKKIVVHYGQIRNSKGKWLSISKKFTTPNKTHLLTVQFIGLKGTAMTKDIGLFAPQTSQELIVPFTMKDGKRSASFPVNNFYRLGSDKKSLLNTTAEISIIDDHLNINITAPDKNTAKALLERNEIKGSGSIFMGDTLEVFIDTNHDHSSFFQFAASPTGKTAAYIIKDDAYIGSWYDDVSNRVKCDFEWKHKVSVSDNCWKVSFNIPLQHLGGTPVAGTCWGMALCRTSKIPPENSSWPCLRKSFHEPLAFAKVVWGKKLNKDSAVKNSDKPVKITSQREPLVLPADKASPKQNEKTQIIPLPQEIMETEGKCYLADISIDAPPETMQIAQELKDILNKFSSGKIETTFNSRENNKLHISFEFSKSLLKQKGKESYDININKNGVEISGGSDQGLFYAVKTLQQLLSKENGKYFLPFVQIRDWPKFEMRGIHIYLKTVDKKYLKELIKLFASLKINAIFLETREAFRYKKHPECVFPKLKSKFSWGRSYIYDADDIKELVALAKKNYIEVIPGTSILSHVPYMLRNHPELRENVKSQRNYCPSNPASYKLLFDLLDETIAAFNPRYFHIGHDEICLGAFRECEKCKTKSAIELFVGDIKKVHDYLKKKNIRSIMWADQLTDYHGNYPYQTKAAANLLPKDIILANWLYNPKEKFTSTGELQDKGFDVYGAVWYKPLNIYNFTNYLAKINSYGVSGTTWYNPYDVRQMAGFILTSEYAWSPGKPEIKALAYDPVNEFLEKTNGKPALPTAKKFLLFDLKPYCDGTYKATGKSDWFGYGSIYDLSSLPTGIKSFGGIPFRIEPGKTDNCLITSAKVAMKNIYPREIKDIKINALLSGMIFLQTTDTLVNPKEGKIGVIEITYADNSKVSINLYDSYKEHANITHWNSAYHPPKTIKAWEGNTNGGARVLLTCMPWKNPYPEKEIKNINVKSSKGSYALLALTGWKN